jgi:SpoVK/Ycf46/Vps4 family AAA+-type ATPase
MPVFSRARSSGKSFLASAVATESQATFFAVSAASLVSKHLGEGERLVRALFAVAREKAPSIVFVDEIDSIMGRRGGDEHEASRRLKTEFFIQMDGASSKSADGSAPRVTVLAATNCPEDLDEALIRRLQRRIYIGSPDAHARRALLQNLFSRPPPGLKHSLTPAQMDSLVSATEGYSNCDWTALVSDAALAPLRALTSEQLLHTPADQLPPVTLEHFRKALQRVRPSVSEERLREYHAWAAKQDAAR